MLLTRAYIEQVQENTERTVSYVATVSHLVKRMRYKVSDRVNIPMLRKKSPG